MKCVEKDQDDSQQQNVMHVFIGPFTINLTTSNPHQTLMNVTLRAVIASNRFRKGEKRVFNNREELVKEHYTSELYCTRNHLYYLFPKYKDYLSENHLLV